MAYAILRVSKLNTIQNIASSLSHTYRTRKTPNADESRSNLNLHSIQNSQTALSEIEKALPSNRRKNAVLCLEYLITASPEYFKNDNNPDRNGEKYFDSSLEWLRKKHGFENVIATSVHLDETTPHLVAYVIPRYEGKLNAKHFTGGKLTLSKMQTEFHKAVAHHGLQRGLEGSKAEHRTITQYYARVNENDAVEPGDVEYPSPSPMDRLQVAQYGQRVADTVDNQHREKYKQLEAKHRKRLDEIDVEYKIWHQAKSAEIRKKLMLLEKENRELQVEMRDMQAENVLLKNHITEQSASIRDLKNEEKAYLEAKETLSFLTEEERNVVNERKKQQRYQQNLNPQKSTKTTANEGVQSLNPLEYLKQKRAESTNTNASKPEESRKNNDDYGFEQ